MKFINETRTNHHGYEYTVTNFDPSTKRYTVYFPHNNVTKVVSVQSVQGDIVSEKPMFAKARGSFNARTATLYFSMRSRLENLPVYKDVKLDPRWETLEGFRATIHLVEGYELWLNYTGYALDKDVKGRRAYGPETCSFIPRTKNSSQPRKRTEHKSYPTGAVLKINDQTIKVVGKNNARTIIRFVETGEVREVWTNNLSIGRIAKSVKGE